MTPEQKAGITALQHTTAELVYSHVRQGNVKLTPDTTPEDLTLQIRELHQPGTLHREVLDNFKIDAIRRPEEGGLILSMSWTGGEDAQLALLEKVEQAESEDKKSESDGQIL